MGMERVFFAACHLSSLTGMGGAQFCPGSCRFSQIGALRGPVSRDTARLSQRYRRRDRFMWEAVDLGRVLLIRKEPEGKNTKGKNF